RTPSQSQCESLVVHVVEGAADWRMLAAFTAGGLACRAGRIGAMGLGSGNVVRALSVVAGLTAEVSTFELMHRGLTTLSRREGPMWPPAPGSTIDGLPQARF